MKTSKKIFALAMSFVMLLGLTACGSRPATVATTASATEAATQPSEAADQTAAATEAASAKALVVYYSASGKTVIPFATSSSSGMGQSGSLLADMAGSGE